jgi:hypothetical protein
MMHERDILQRLVAPADPPRLFAEVLARRPDGRYKVRDDLQRTFTVDGDGGYLPGARVIIQAGRIVDTGSRAAITKTIRV